MKGILKFSPLQESFLDSYHNAGTVISTVYTLSYITWSFYEVDVAVLSLKLEKPWDLEITVDATINIGTILHPSFRIETLVSQL